MKFCKDCKWYHPENFGKCETPKNGFIPTSGTPNIYSATYARSTDKDKYGVYCGPSAKWFEEKEKPIPLCKGCKWEAWESACLYPKVDELTGFNTAINKSLTTCRSDESLCGKYGKWWEKKEEITKEAIAKCLEVLEPPKKQSWLCRLICGRKK